MIHYRFFIISRIHHLHFISLSTKMAEIFRIDFIGSQSSFSAGQNVQARVILQLSESMKARSIDLHISGKAEVDWSEHERKGKVGKKGHSHRVPYHSEETYLNQNIVLWASADQEIPVGEHVFPFQFTIPPDCPPSFEGTLGHIRYTCSANIDRPWRFDTKVNVAFVVSPFVDLNTIDWVRSPAVQQIDDSIGSCCCKHGNIRAKVRLPKSGFVPGEGIPITIEIENATSKQVKKVKAKLIENVKYKAQRQRGDWGKTQHFGERDDSRTIAEMEKQFMVAPRSKRTFRGHLAIPPCTASFNNCEIIQLSYFMEVKIVTTSFFCGSVSTRFHLQIGTIPFQQQPQSPAPTVQPQSKMDDSDDCTEQTRLWIEEWSKERVCLPVETLPLNEPIYEDKVRFVCISDTHERLGEILDQIPNGDVLLHCGDFTNVGRRSAIINFNNQMGRLPHRHKIVIPGNHELGFDPTSPIPSRLADAGYGTPNGHELLTNVTYLRDSSTKVFGLTIYGSPWQSHKGLAFYRGRGEPIRREWEKIPAAVKIAKATGGSSSSSNGKWLPQVDILMTHSPPLGHNDWEDWGDPNKFRHLGCRDLPDFVEDRIRPKVHVFGHIHQRNGATTNGQTLFINASICDNDGKVCAQPRIFDLPLPEGYTKKGG